jgi:hypothetical protein
MTAKTASFICKFSIQFCSPLKRCAIFLVFPPVIYIPFRLILKKMKKLFSSLCLVFIFEYTVAQPTIQWQKSIGGTDVDYTGGIEPTSDGGFILIGGTYSNDGDVTGYHDNGDLWIIKMDRQGTIEWQKCLGGTEYDDLSYPTTANCIKQTTDGGYILTGVTYSINGDITASYGNGDMWLAKLDANGNIEWQRCLGGSADDYGTAVIQTTDGGYTVAGYTSSTDINVMGNHGQYDMWMVHVDVMGEIKWQKCLGGSDEDYCSAIAQTTDGGYIVAGQTWSIDGDVSGNHGLSDEWIVKTDKFGNMQWQKCLGGSSDESAASVFCTATGGYIVAGWTDSNDGDISNPFTNTDCWVVELDNMGNINWEKCYGSPQAEICYSMQQTTDGGYILSCQNWGNGGQVSGHHGSIFNSDYWIAKIDMTGNLQWQSSLGGASNEFAVAALETADGGYVISGGSNSNTDDVSGNHGNYDAWIVKLSFTTNVVALSSPAPSISVSPNPAQNSFVIYLDKDLKLQHAELKIYDVAGKDVYHQTVSQQSEIINANLSAGIYYIKVTDGDSVHTQKLMVE